MDDQKGRAGLGAFDFFNKHVSDNTNYRTTAIIVCACVCVCVCVLIQLNIVTQSGPTFLVIRFY